MNLFSNVPVGFVLLISGCGFALLGTAIFIIGKPKPVRTYKQGCAVGMVIGLVIGMWIGFAIGWYVTFTASLR